MSMNQSSPLDLERPFHAHQHELIARLQRTVGCCHTAADLAQDTYVRLLRIDDPQEIALKNLDLWVRFPLFGSS